MAVNLSMVDSAMTTMDKIKTYLVAGMDTAIDVVSDFTDYEIQEFDDETEQELKKITTEYIAMERDMKRFADAMAKLKQDVKDKDCEDENLLEMLEKHIASTADEDEGLDVKQHPKYKTLQEKINVAKTLEAEESNSMEEDVQVSQAIVSTKCPFSGKEITEPVKNLHCGHTYDKDGIKQLIKQRKGKARCPVSGCANATAVSENDLVEDKLMKRAISMKKRQMKASKS